MTLSFSRQGTAKLHYVTVRVFRTLLSKGLCSDETEEGEGEGDGDINGMKVWCGVKLSYFVEWPLFFGGYNDIVQSGRRGTAAFLTWLGLFFHPILERRLASLG